MNKEPSVHRIERLELTFEPMPWAFAREHRHEIDTHFAELQRDKPNLWNGRVLVMHRQCLRRGVFRGAYLEADYASFAAWHRWDYPPANAYDCFGAGAVIGSDGGVLLGMMSDTTLNAGHIYFPCGTPDPSDVSGGMVDLDSSLRRELEEETGLAASDFHAEPGWTAIMDKALIAQVRVFRATEKAEALRERALAHLSRQMRPELADIVVARSPADFTPNMRRFVRAFLAHLWCS